MINGISSLFDGCCMLFIIIIFLDTIVMAISPCEHTSALQTLKIPYHDLFLQGVILICHGKRSHVVIALILNQYKCVCKKKKYSFESSIGFDLDRRGSNYMPTQRSQDYHQYLCFSYSPTEILNYKHPEVDETLTRNCYRLDQLKILVRINRTV